MANVKKLVTLDEDVIEAIQLFANTHFHGVFSHAVEYLAIMGLQSEMSEQEGDN